MQAYEAAQRVFGENYVQELCEKATQMPNDVQWHFIGHLQSNKASDIVAIPNLTVVETVDRPKIADALQRACAKIGRAQLDVFIQVNTSAEDTKSGCEPSEALGLVSHVLTHCPALRVRGLMTIGSPNPEPADRDFVTLRSLRDEVSEKLKDRLSSPLELSMGMSHDYKLAIECGATNVRVGSSIFGSRTPAT
jgi:pyridoxal phosphate enzyme (YggS family)